MRKVIARPPPTCEKRVLWAVTHQNRGFIPWVRAGAYIQREGVLADALPQRSVIRLGEQLGLLGSELGIGENTLGVQISQLGKLIG